MKACDRCSRPPTTIYHTGECPKASDIEWIPLTPPQPDPKVLEIEYCEECPFYLDGGEWPSVCHYPGGPWRPAYGAEDCPLHDQPMLLKDFGK